MITMTRFNGVCAFSSELRQAPELTHQPYNHHPIKHYGTCHSILLLCNNNYIGLVSQYC